MRTRLLPSLFLLVLTRLVQAQCAPAWIEEFPTDDLEPAIRASIVFDDGAGPALYIASENDSNPISMVRRWTGDRWSFVGDLQGYVYALAVFDADGPGPNPARLYAGGAFLFGYATYDLAIWDGAAWVRAGDGEGPNGGVHALIVHDEDGNGPSLPSLFVGGTFTQISGMAIGGIAKWNGQSWSGLADGVAPAGSYRRVNALASFDRDGDGPQPPVLVAGGRFAVAGGLYLGSWNGATWSLLGGVHPDAEVYALAAWSENPLSSVQTLYAGGLFGGVGSVVARRVARFGSSWSALDSGVSAFGFSPSVRAFAPFDVDGPGPERPSLIVGGQFHGAGISTCNSVARWTGHYWTPVGDGVQTLQSRSVQSLTPLPPGIVGPTGHAVFAGGSFTSAGGIRAPFAAVWDGAAWARVGRTTGPDSPVRTMTSYDPDGDGPEPAQLVIGGAFLEVGSTPAAGIATRRDGAWEPLGAGFISVHEMITFDADGPGPAPPSLIAAHAYTPAGRLSRWNGATWDPISADPLAVVDSVLVWDEDGPGPGPEALFVLGAAPGVRRWDGATWSDLGGGLNGNVYRGAVLDPDGPGPAPPALYVFGTFTTADGLPAPGAARWDGHAWTPIAAPPPLNSNLVVFDADGSGPEPAAIYAGTAWTTLNGQPDEGLLHFDGQSWSLVLPGVTGGIEGPIITVLCVHDDDGPGPTPPALYAAGAFSHAGGMPARNIARWNGAAWSPLGSGAANEYSIEAMLSFDPDGAGPDLPSLFVGGDFTLMGGLGAANIARWACPHEPFCPADYNTDFTIDSSDISAFLTAWLGSVQSGSLAADFNADGQVNSTDISAFLTSWLDAVQNGC